MIDRYAQKDLEKITLKEDDFVVLTVKEDPKFPARGLGFIVSINKADNQATVYVEEEYRGSLEGEEAETGIIVRSLDVIEKPLEVFWEQIALRVAKGLSKVEKTVADREKYFGLFARELVKMNFIPAGRVLYGANSGSDVTFFNCYVMPNPADSREGISKHRQNVMEIMSRGGGVGTNGSTLRPRHALARGVNGKSSGSVSWLDDIAKLTHLVEQGGSRRGAQMIMLASSHPDIVEFIVSKMQNPKILRFLLQTAKDEQIKQMVQEKLHFKALTPDEHSMYQTIVDTPKLFSPVSVSRAEGLLTDGGTYTVNNPEFLSGANISVCITDDFMEALDQNAAYALKFPDVENYDKETMAIYNEKWHEVGDVREWERMGYAVKTYRTIQAKELWNLINICATYAAEPGIFFIDNANNMTNASAYGQKVVATNPCGGWKFASR